MSQGAEIKEARLMKVEEAVSLKCSMSSGYCGNTPEWVYSTSYWTGSADSSSSLWYVYSKGYLKNQSYSKIHIVGVRPVIVISI